MMLLITAGTTRAEPVATDPPFSELVAAWSSTLDGMTALDATHGDLEAAFGQAHRVEREARTARAHAADDLVPVHRELDALGPAPEEGTSPELPSVARLRARLEAEAAAIEARLKQADALVARAGAFQTSLRRFERERLRGHLRKRGPSPLNPAVWRRSLDGLASIAAELGATVTTWWTRGPPATRGPAPFAWPLAIGALALLVGLRVKRWLTPTFGLDAAVEAPDLTRRLVGATVESIAATVTPGLALLVALLVLIELDLLTGRMAIITSGLLMAGLVLISMTTLARAAFSSSLPEWRWVLVDDERARTIRRRLLELAVFLAGSGLLRWTTDGVGERSPDLEAVLAAVVTVPLGTLLLLLVQRRLWEVDETSTWGTVRFATGAAAVLMLLAALAGWAHLAHEIARATILSGLALLGFTLARTLIDTLLALALAPEHPSSARIRDFLGLEERGGTIALFWLRLLADAALAISVVLLWLVGLGLPWTTLSVWVSALADGVDIGSLHVSFTDLVMAGFAVAAILAVTRFLRHTLEERVLPQTQLGTGAQHSLTASIRYAGLLIASAVGVSTLGLDLSNLALLAGALSVGIGFGLQNVVNNFVSGLIMLVERPIKLGDWVVLGGFEGIVKRINVRATELETFQRSAVIIPNSEVLASAVVNWTHRDHYGRVEIPVGVAYGSDVEQVRDLLLACAKGHPEITSLPAPSVLFRDFGSSSLDFELRAYLRDNGGRLRVMSDLRFAIDAAFRRHQIEIPFPQHDLHVRDLDRVGEMLHGRHGTSKEASADPSRPIDSQESTGSTRSHLPAEPQESDAGDDGSGGEP